MPIAEIARLVHARRRRAVRRRRGAGAAPRRRRAGARLRLVRLQLLQDLRAAPGRAVGPPRAAARARQPQPLLHRQGPRALQAAARQRELRAGLGLRRHPGLSGRALADHHARRAVRADRRARGGAGRAPAGLAARPQRRPHHRPPRAATATSACRRSASPSRADDPSEIVAAVDRAPGRHPLRRLLRPPPDRGSWASPSRTASSASRWSTTTRWPKSTA